MKAAWKTTALVVMIGVVAGALSYRYYEYRLYRDIRVFFDQTAPLLPFSMEEISRSPMLPIPEALPDGGNLIAHVVNEQTGTRNFRYATETVFAGYGRIDGFVPPSQWVQDENTPTWFLITPRPGSAMAEVSITKENQGWVYSLQEAPYDASNGLWSKGFLYVDALGRRSGYYDSFHPLRR